MARSQARRLGSHPAAVWTVKHVVNPLDRMLVRMSKGRISPLSSLAVPTLLMTTVGRRSGKERTVPLVYLRDGGRYVVANARPAGERRNPWVLNLGTAGSARIQAGGRTIEVSARPATEDEIGHWWPELVDVWPAFGEHYAATGERSIFVLDPIDRAG
jgi:deazaflavin-dependent oxidoreductase (nitroreductase family)